MTPVPFRSPRVRRLRVLLTMLAMLGASACASGGSAGPRPGRVQPPKMVSTTRSPELRPAAGAPGQSPVDVRIEVAVDVSGRADLSTLRVTGRGANMNQAAIARWLEDARFEPARQDGQPVRGMFRTEIAARMVARRM